MAANAPPESHRVLTAKNNVLEVGPISRFGLLVDNGQQTVSEGETAAVMLDDCRLSLARMSGPSFFLKKDMLRLAARNQKRHPSIHPSIRPSVHASIVYRMNRFSFTCSKLGNLTASSNALSWFMSITCSASPRVKMTAWFWFSGLPCQ